MLGEGREGSRKKSLREQQQKNSMDSVLKIQKGVEEWSEGAG